MRVIGRIFTAIATFGVAILLLLAVPVSQLRTFTVDKSCCCPDPTSCHCPDHVPSKLPQSSMRACHNTQEITTGPELPAFEPAIIAMLVVDETVLALSTPPSREPHLAPPAKRPDAPS